MIGEAAGSTGGPVGSRPVLDEWGIDALVERAGDVTNDVLRDCDCR